MRAASRARAGRIRAIVCGTTMLVAVGQVLAQAEADYEGHSPDTLFEAIAIDSIDLDVDYHQYAQLDSPLYAVDEPRRPSRVNESEWAALTEGLVYERKQPNPPPDLPNWNIPQGLLDLLGVLVWVLVAALVLGIAYYLYRNYRPSESLSSGRSTSLTDELLAASDDELADALQQRLDSGDYRAAVSYRFGQLLQTLRRAGLLVWVPGKTNADYAAEMPEAARAPFGRISDSFSYANYSGRDIDIAYYERFDVGVDELQRDVAAGVFATPAAFAKTDGA